MLILFVCLLFQAYFGYVDSASGFVRCRTHKFGVTKKIRLSGGEISVEEKEVIGNANVQKNANIVNSPNTPNISVVISTSLGSSFLDKTKKISISRNSTVFDLKIITAERFPGNPPTELQRLFLGSSLLKDSDSLSDIATQSSSSSSLYLLLDMISGTSTYSKPATIRHALEAYASTIVHQAYLGKIQRQLLDLKIKEELGGEELELENENNEELETLFYRQFFEIINETVHNQYSEDISLAFIEESNPAISSPETDKLKAKLREPNRLQEFIAREFDCNSKTVKQLLFYSATIMFVRHSIDSPSSKLLLSFTIPLLWISKLRHFRLFSKYAMNVLYLSSKSFPLSDFLLSLMSAPFKVLAKETNLISWENIKQLSLIPTANDISKTIDEDEDSNEKEDENDDEENEEENEEENDEEHDEEEHDEEEVEKVNEELNEELNEVLNGDQNINEDGDEVEMEVFEEVVQNEDEQSISNANNIVEKSNNSENELKEVEDDEKENGDEEGESEEENEDDENGEEIVGEENEEEDENDEEEVENEEDVGEEENDEGSFDENDEDDVENDENSDIEYDEVVEVVDVVDVENEEDEDT